MDNGELGIVPGAVQRGDVIVFLSGAISLCVLRSLPDGSWTLMSGDCHMFTDDFTHPGDGHGHGADCNEYVACNQDRIEEFRLR